METPWVLDMGELADAELTPPPPHSKAPQIDVKNFEGRVRKTSCSSFGMGMKVRAANLTVTIPQIQGQIFWGRPAPKPLALFTFCLLTAVNV